MSRYIKLKVVLSLCFCTLILGSCSKMDATFKEFMKDGERIYVGKADSAIVFSGRGRVQLQWLAIADPKITRAKVFWNNKSFTKELTINKTKGIDTVRVFIDDLAEGEYSFEIVHYDTDGNFSMESHVSGKSYGTAYATSLLPRPINDYNLVDGSVLINWGGAMVGLVGMEITYTDNTGTDRSLIIPAEATETSLDKFVSGQKFRYRTAYLPDSLSLDTFHTEFKELMAEFIPEEEALDKTKFAILKLPGDTWENNVAVRSLEKIWDGLTTGAANSFNGKVGVAFPQHFTIDLGVTSALSRMMYWPKAVSGDSYTTTPKYFEIWGSNNPDADGSWGNWTKLLDAEYIKPSGLPGSEHTTEDRNYSLAGIEYRFPEGTQPYRYIRFNTLELWSGNNVNIYEITFFGFNQ